MNKVYACTDLHGMLPLWQKIQKYCDKNDTIYVLGDAADRGADSWETLKSVLSDPRVKYIRGNHDQMMLDAWRYEWTDCDLWFYNGGYITFSQMTQDPEHELYLKELSKSPFIRVYVRPDGSYVHLTHAGFTFVERDIYPDKKQLIWDREHIFDKSQKALSDYIICGHTPIPSFARIEGLNINDSRTVAKKDNKIFIDSGCVRHKKIALLNLDTLEEKVFSIDD